jgi:hypothetical protein
MTSHARVKNQAPIGSDPIMIVLLAIPIKGTSGTNGQLNVSGGGDCGSILSSMPDTTATVALMIATKWWLPIITEASSDEKVNNKVHTTGFIPLSFTS